MVVTDSGIVTDVSFLLLKNAYVPIDVIESDKAT